MLKRAYIAADPVDAHMVRGMLEALGIHAVVKGDIAWSARGETPPMDDTSPQVWVDEGDVTVTREVKDRIGSWPKYYNHEHPHSSLEDRILDEAYRGIAPLA